MAKDLRTYLESLEKAFPEEIKRVKKAVDGGAYEASALLEALDWWICPGGKRISA